MAMDFFESNGSTVGRSFVLEGGSSRSEYWYWLVFTTPLFYFLGFILGYIEARMNSPTKLCRRKCH